ncbi:hypothetical protein [Stieleria mannarensis]|uniref:hypothetical protein n=1 Tax=Stieleria mannarensis TaxID=2755585 RepID=UPI0015FF6CC3|nr:hypothetical protein [Rhodopirellula sp. JC639]
MRSARHTDDSQKHSAHAALQAAACWVALATTSLALSGCRSGNPIRSTVQVTEDPTAVVADLPAPEQRLATSSTGKERGLVRVGRDATQANLASTATNKPEPRQEKPAPRAVAAPPKTAPQTQMSLTDASSVTGATDVDVSAAGLVSASLSDLSATHQSNRPGDAEAAVRATPVARTQTLAGGSSQRRPTTQRQTFNQTELPHALTVAIEQSLNELPALPDSRMVAGDLSPVRLGTGADQLARLDDLRSAPQSTPLDQVAETSIEDAPVDDLPVDDLPANDLAESPTAVAASGPPTSTTTAGNPVTKEPVGNEPVISEAVANLPVTDDSLASRPAVGNPVPPPPSTEPETPATEPRLAAQDDFQQAAQDDPGVVMNANQVQPASHAGDAGELEVASHQQVADEERVAPEVVTPEAMTAELTEAELYQQLLDRISQTQDGESPIQRERRQIVMRHLMVLAGQPESAIESMQGLNPTEQLYLQNQLMGLWTMIDPEGHPSSGRRITEALPKFREATRHMATATDSLALTCLEFCTEIESYGQIKPFEGNRFVAGQQVILYCEIENFAAEDHSGYFQTRLQGSYDIYNADGTKVISQLLPVDQQRSRNRLRDYFVAYQMNLPKGLPHGTYRLQLTIEDVVGKKYGQSSIPFEIR